MKLIPSESLLKHLIEQGLSMPAEGFEVLESVYDQISSDIRSHAIHAGEAASEIKDRIDYAVIWKLHAAEKKAGELQEVAKGEIAEAIAGLKMFSAESHAEALKVRGDLHADLMELLGKIHKLGKWLLGVIVSALVLVALLMVLGVHAHCQIDVIKFQDNAGSAVGTVAAPFTIKAGSNCSLAKVGPIVTFNCTGGAAAAGGSNTQVQYNNATALAGISTFTTTGTVSTAQAGLNWFFVDTGDTSKKFRFDVSNLTTATTRVVNIPDANSTTVQPDTGAANNFISGISAQGVITKSVPVYANLSGLPTLAATKTAVAGSPLLSYDSTTGLFTQGALTAAQVGALSSSTVLPVTKTAVAGSPLLSYDSTTGAFTQGALTAAQVGALSSSTVLPVTKTAVAGSPLLSYDSTTGAFTQGALTAANVGLGSVTNDAQTKAAVMPNTAPGAGQLPIGNAGGTAYAPTTLSGPVSITSAGVTAVATLNQNTSGTAANLSGTPALPNGTTATTQAAADNSTKLATTAYADAVLKSQYKIWTCESGMGDGLNAVTAGTYLQSFCYNTTGVSVTLTGLKCYTDNAGSSTLNAAGNTLGALLTGAVTCSASFAAGTQSANVLLTNGDYIKFTWVADGTSKQSTWVATGTY